MYMKFRMDSKWNKYIYMHAYVFMYISVECNNKWLITISVEHKYTYIIQPVAFGVSFFQSQKSIDDLVLLVSFATFR